MEKYRFWFFLSCKLFIMTSSTSPPHPLSPPQENGGINVFPLVGFVVEKLGGWERRQYFGEHLLALGVRSTAVQQCILISTFLQLKKVEHISAHLSYLALVLMEILKLIRKSKNPWADWFDCWVGYMISSVTSFRSSRREVGMVHHFITVIYCLVIS